MQLHELAGVKEDLEKVSNDKNFLEKELTNLEGKYKVMETLRDSQETELQTLKVKNLQLDNSGRWLKIFPCYEYINILIDTQLACLQSLSLSLLFTADETVGAGVNTDPSARKPQKHRGRSPLSERDCGPAEGRASCW